MRSSPVAILYEYYIINLKDRNIPPKKHYEIPFLKECALLFFLLHRILTERDNAIQGYTVLFSHIIPEENALMRSSLWTVFY